MPGEGANVLDSYQLHGGTIRARKPTGGRAAVAESIAADISVITWYDGDRAASHPARDTQPRREGRSKIRSAVFRNSASPDFVSEKVSRWSCGKA